jgi:hypothetical protein
VPICLLCSSLLALLLLLLLLLLVVVVVVVQARCHLPGERGSRCLSSWQAPTGCQGHCRQNGLSCPAS